MTMDIRDFGDRLIQTGDLDPVYCAIHGAQLDSGQLYRLLLAYWCFYHLGVAGWMSEWEGTDYWHFMFVAAQNRDDMRPRDGAGWPCNNIAPQFDRWPRMAERRHFRGQKCVRAVEYLQEQFGEPEAPVFSLGALDTEQKVMASVQQWPLFGPWIAFKAADMLERVGGMRINFSPNIGLIYAEPREALGLLNRADVPGQIGFVGTGEKAIYQGLLTYFQPRRAPPSGNRCCGPQEVETVLCKWKSHARGHYEVGKDIREVRHSLEGWGATAQRMLQFTPQDVSTAAPPGEFAVGQIGAGVG